MADFATMEIPSKGGKTNWLLIGGAAAGILGLIVLMSKSNSSGTTAAGMSINAGIGSLQEEQMNLLGQIEKGFMTNATSFSGVNQNITSSQTAVIQAIQDQGKTIIASGQAQIDTVNQNANANKSGVLASLADALGKILSGQQAMTSVIQGGATANTNDILHQLQVAEQALTGQINQSQAVQVGALGDVAARLSALLQQVAQQGNIASAAQQSQISSLQQTLTAQIAAEQGAFNNSINGLSTQFTGFSASLSQLASEITKLQQPIVNTTDINWNLFNGYAVDAANGSFFFTGGKAIQTGWYYAKNHDITKIHVPQALPAGIINPGNLGN